MFSVGSYAGLIPFNRRRVKASQRVELARNGYQSLVSLLTENHNYMFNIKPI